MITVNISGFEEIRNKIASIDMDRLCYDVASTLKDKIKHRVHVEGLASDGSPIGTYSKGYMNVRTGNYEETRLKSGKNKGKFREEKSQAKAQAGVFTKGPRKGQSRPVYNRGTKENIVLSLTRQMEKDMDATNPIPIESGYGIGYSNDFNYDKAIWNKARYGKKIWSLTQKENQLAQKIVSKYVNEINN
jgi:hypothetical protein